MEVNKSLTEILIKTFIKVLTFTNVYLIRETVQKY
jgi:hypothetical protein